MKSIRKKSKRKMPKNKTKCHKHNKHFFCPYCDKKMKGGCSCGTGAMFGGNDVAQSLAYTRNTPHYDKNPYLAYTGKSNTNVIYPDVTGPPGIKLDWLNNLKFGGGGVGGGNYPNGLIGNDWNPNYQYPNVSGTTNNNHYKLNTYAPNDISRNTILSGSAKPFSIGGKKRKNNTRRNSRKRKNGGGYFQGPSSILNDVSYNLGKYTSNLQGLKEPPNPLPFQDQLKDASNNLKYYL
jgi:hypothetical protein